jgi:hypothetical protein
MTCQSIVLCLFPPLPFTFSFMNLPHTFRLSKYARLLIGAVAILIICVSAHRAFEHHDRPIPIPIQIGLLPTTPPKPGIGWDISTISGAAEIELADYLTQQDVKMYGAYWCPHCHEQAQLFGKKAWSRINHIECVQDAQENPQPDVCKQAGIKGFPTWSINGKLDPGVKKLARLAEMTGYQGNPDFKYDRLIQR